MAVNSVYANLDSERIVLASILRGRKGLKIARKLSPEDFYTEDHKRLFVALQALCVDGRKIDYVLIAQKLTTLYGNDADMAELIDAQREHGATAEYVADDHAAIIQAAARRRQARTILQRAQRLLDAPENDMDPVLDDMRAGIRALCDGANDGTQSLSSVLLASYDEIERRCKGENRGISCGIDVLDHHLGGGLHKGELTILGARPAVGKSALAMHMAIAAAGSGNRVMICSREMSAEQYGVRILARGTNVPNSRIRQGDLTDDDWQQLADSMSVYGGISDRVSFTFAARTIEELRDTTMAEKEQNGLDVLVVDYVQLLQARKRFDKDYLRIAYVSKMLKDMTIDLNIAILALAQVGRASEGNMPTMAELRGSGDLEQDADNILFLHRPPDVMDKSVYPDDRSLYAMLNSMGQRYMVLNIAKQRQGDTGAIQLIFDPQHMDFRSVNRRESAQEAAYGAN